MGISGGRGDESVAGGEVRVLASSICPPRSPAVASHASITNFTTPCFLIPRHERIVGELLKHTVREGTVASRSDLT